MYFSKDVEEVDLKMNICLDCQYINNVSREPITIQVGGINYDAFLLIGFVLLNIILIFWIIYTYKEYKKKKS